MAGIFTEDSDKEKCELEKVMAVVKDGNYNRDAMLEHLRKAVILLFKIALQNKK